MTGFMCTLFTQDDPFNLVMNYLESMEPRTSIVLIAHRVHHRWELTRKAKELRDLYEAILFVGTMRFGISNCVGARLVRGHQRLQGLALREATEAPIYYYSPPHRDNYHVHLPTVPGVSIELKELINNKQDDDYCFIQFIGVASETRQEVTKHIPNIPILAGQGMPDISTPRSTASWGQSTLAKAPSMEGSLAQEVTAPCLRNNDFSGDLAGPPRRCPVSQLGQGTLSGSAAEHDDAVVDQTAFTAMIEDLGTEVPVATGWEDWTSEKQRAHELLVWFKDLLPKDTDHPPQIVHLLLLIF